ISRPLRRRDAAGRALQRGAAGHRRRWNAGVAAARTRRSNAARGSAAMRGVATLGTFAFLVSMAQNCAAHEVHGSADAFAMPGIALAWAVLRAAKEDDTAVVVRIDVDA